CFQVRSGNTSDGPWTYTAGAGQSLSDTWNVAQNNQGRYDLSVYGPNGFLRSFRGSASSHTKANLEIDCRYDIDEQDLVLVITNRGPIACRVSLADAYDDDSEGRALRPGQSFHKRFSLRSSFGWYDVMVEVNTDQNFLRRLAGHVENGRDSVSDPAIGNVGDRGRPSRNPHSEQGAGAGM